MINYRTFSSCTNLTSVQLPENLKTIGDYAFAFCDKLSTINIPNSVDSIGIYGLSYCAFTSIQLPPNITKIQPSTFEYCSNLSSIIIPAKVSAIGVGAFSLCKELKEIYYAAENPIESTSDIFDESIYPTAILYVPTAAVDKAATITPWNLFSNIKAYDFTSAITDIATDLDPTTPVEVYNISGMKVTDSTDSLPAGIYIVRQGNTVKKISVK